MPEPIPAYSAETLVARLREIADASGRRNIPAHEFQTVTGISTYYVTRVFGSYSALREAAGLLPPPNKKRSKDSLLTALRDACLKAGGIPSASHIERFGAHSKAAYYARWGDWRGTLRALRDWVEVNDPGFAFRSGLPAERSGPARPPKAPGAVYGAPLQFGPLTCEPTNEMGVVVLFGVLAMKLGFAIERVGTGFPDCEAKQRVSGGWRRVRIEFEYKSRNFERHGHDPEGCDLIVCWEHDWKEAPVEVLELKRHAQGAAVSPEAPAANSRTN